MVVDRWSLFTGDRYTNVVPNHKCLAIGVRYNDFVDKYNVQQKSNGNVVVLKKGKVPNCKPPKII